MQNSEAISLSSSDFRHAISLAGKCIERNNKTIPTLSMIHARANGVFEATGTDLDVLVSASVPRAGSAEATFLIPDYRSIIGAVKAGGGSDVTLEPAEGKFALASDTLSVEVVSNIAADDFPLSGQLIAHDEFTATLSHEQLRSLRRIAASISKAETRYYLNGIYLHHIDGTTFRAVATDGHRLSVIDLEIPDASGALEGIIIPRKAIRLLLEMIGNKAGAADPGIAFRVGTGMLRNREDSTAPERKGVSRAHFSLRAGNASVTLATKLIDGTYPDYARVIPSESGRSFLFKSAEFRRALEAVSFGSKDVRAVRLDFDSEGATVSAKYVSGIASAVRISCQHSGEPWEVGFSGSHLIDMIDAAGGDEFVLSAADATGPALIKNPADPDWTGVLMPCRL
ncbi:DNA polymerase III subunit beta [Sphingomonas oleivorans]|uniref:Beta sliding clamp n=1 Tax=Sphingomonas oleivorans TaxID=1735121 RepID=A0A2T5G1F5_9SPHN|nr:DNA polymerase III subunit beta [Sphingomonas oleivorans]PTQ12940.1 DNA polymerase III subunit beta [Sphingomonas oleivorans]